MEAKLIVGFVLLAIFGVGKLKYGFHLPHSIVLDVIFIVAVCLLYVC